MSPHTAALEVYLPTPNVHLRNERWTLSKGSFDILVNGGLDPEARLFMKLVYGSHIGQP